MAGVTEAEQVPAAATESVPDRWTKGTVYDDMWVDPADDPRESDEAVPDGELPTLLDYLRNYRLTLRMKCDGLDAEQLARRSVPPSTMSLLGLVRHLAGVEHYWGTVVVGGQDGPRPFTGDDDFDGAVGDETVVAEAFALWDQEMAATDAAVAAHPDVGERLASGDGIAVREVLVHLIEEYARHCGHADLIRERIDGRVGQ
ncbi:DinB family protein [Actinopolymorpha alba]|uniref:DinB family protein n=1 Tax=Actinopolymorpha alba TaxID=533267 RepID=UPI00035CFA4A